MEMTPLELDKIKYFLLTFVTESAASRLMGDTDLISFCDRLKCGDKVILEDGKSVYVVKKRVVLFKTPLLEGELL